MSSFQWYLAVTGLLTMAAAWWMYGSNGAYWYARDHGDYLSEMMAPYVVGAPAVLFVGGVIVKAVLVVIGS